jgi:hypothetical protein
MIHAPAQIILLDGPPGAAKSLASVILSEHATVLPKLKTAVRALQPGDPAPLDTIASSAHHFALLRKDPRFYCYRFGKGEYGFHADSLHATLRLPRPVLVTVRSNAVIMRLKQDFREFGVIAVLLCSDSALIATQLKKHDPQVVRQRLQRSDEFWREYDPLLYDATIINNGTVDQLRQMLFSVIARYCRREAS